MDLANSSTDSNDFGWQQNKHSKHFKAKYLSVIRVYQVLLFLEPVCLIQLAIKNSER